MGECQKSEYRGLSTALRSGRDDRDLGAPTEVIGVLAYGRDDGPEGAMVDLTQVHARLRWRLVRSLGESVGFAGRGVDVFVDVADDVG